VSSTRWYTVGRDALDVVGPEAEGFLQGQLSQEMTGPPPWSRWSFVLQPSGKVDALVRVTRLADDRFVVDVDAGFGDQVAARLARFKLRTRAEIEPLAGWQAIAVRGPDSAAVPLGGHPVASWPMAEATDALGPDLQPPALAAGDAADYEWRRIAAGWPAMGAELTAEVIPNETGLVPVAVSFTKGCYTGQELVARIDSRGGNVPRHLRRLSARPDTAMAVGDALFAGDREVGRVTSAATGASGPVGLAYLARAVEAPGVVHTSAGGAVEVSPLPT
jgi:folate-binding protein YgfZ